MRLSDLIRSSEEKRIRDRDAGDDRSQCRTLRLTNAGHPPPTCCATARSRRSCCRGAPLGALDDTYGDRELPLKPATWPSGYRTTVRSKRQTRRGRLRSTNRVRQASTAGRLGGRGSRAPDGGGRGARAGARRGGRPDACGDALSRQRCLLRPARGWWHASLPPHGGDRRATAVVSRDPCEGVVESPAVDRGGQSRDSLPALRVEERSGPSDRRCAPDSVGLTVRRHFRVALERPPRRR